MLLIITTPKLSPVKAEGMQMFVVKGIVALLVWLSFAFEVHEL